MTFLSSLAWCEVTPSAHQQVKITKICTGIIIQQTCGQKKKKVIFFEKKKNVGEGEIETSENRKLSMEEERREGRRAEGGKGGSRQ